MTVNIGKSSWDILLTDSFVDSFSDKHSGSAEQFGLTLT